MSRSTRSSFCQSNIARISVLLLLPNKLYLFRIIRVIEQKYGYCSYNRFGYNPFRFYNLANSTIPATATLPPVYTPSLGTLCDKGPARRPLHFLIFSDIFTCFSFFHLFLLFFTVCFILISTNFQHIQLT